MDEAPGSSLRAWRFRVFRSFRAFRGQLSPSDGPFLGDSLPRQGDEVGYAQRTTLVPRA